MGLDLRRLFHVLLFVLALVYGAPLSAQPQNEEENQPEALAKQLGRIERALERGVVDEATLTDWLKLIDSTKERATECIPDTEQVLEKVSKDLVSLGAPAAGEPREVARQRDALEHEKTTQENRLATCRVLIQRSEELAPKLTELQKKLRAQRFLAQGPTIFDVLQDERLRVGALVTATRTFVRVHSGVDVLSVSRLVVLALVLLSALVAGGLLRQRLVKWIQRHRWRTNLSSHLGRSLLTAFGHYAPHLLFSLAAAVFFFFATWQVQPIPFLSVVAYGLPPYFLVITLVHIFLAPFAPAELFLPLPSAIGRALARRLKVLALLVFLGYLLFATLLSQSLPEPALLLTRAAFALVVFVNLAWALLLLGHVPVLAKTLWLRLVLLLTLLTALLAELWGYRNLSVWVLRAVIGTLIGLGLLALALRLFRELFDGLQAGRHPWHRRLRQALALKAGQPFPGLVWMRLIAAIFAWVAFALAILRIWGLPQTFLEQLYRVLIEGFTVGLLHVNPARILLAVVTLTLLLALSGWIRSRLKRYWLAKTRMDRGAREATVTISGYTGIAIAVLVALAVAGFEFTNLAIIAGALSVGIGFGLQNIVNNFVSGLILLFERPIRTGDWIIVGNTEGYVKRISIRSTHIQTFDRADVIVPNSDLISNQVTNWMLYEPRGRIKVPVGVAYGSDTEKVREVLLEVAHEHPRVISDENTPAPNVLFLRFGDSSLDFELRCHIDQIDYRLQVVSDLNFAIDKAFREHGIEIPFPQRDVHVRDWSAPEKQAPVSGEKKRQTRAAHPSGRRVDTDSPESPVADD